MKPIVLLASQGGDIRLRRATRYLRSKNHDVVQIFGWSNYDHRAPFAPTEQRDGCPAFVAHAARPDELRRAIGGAFDPALVWCFGLDAAWRYLAADTLTPAVRSAIAEGASIAESGWHSRRGPVPVVYDAPEYERGRPWRWPRARTLRDWGTQEALVIAVSAAIATVSTPIAEALARDHTLGTRPTVISNAPLRPRPIGMRGPTIPHTPSPSGGRLAFAGNTNPDRALDLLAGAVLRLRGRRPGLSLSIFGEDTDGDVRTLLSGAGAQWRGVQPYPWPDATAPTLLDALARCDVGYSGAWVEYPTWAMSAPNKLFEYLFAGIPQVAPAGMVVFEDLVARYGPRLGRTFKPDSVASLTDALDAVLSTPRPEYPADVVADLAYEPANGPAVDAMMERIGAQ